MKNYLLILLCICCLKVSGQKTIKDITAANLEGEQRILKLYPSMDTKYVIYYGAINQYHLCDRNDKVLKTKQSQDNFIEDDADCSEGLNNTIEEVDINIDLLQKVSCQALADDSWQLYLPGSEWIKGRHVTNIGPLMSQAYNDAKAGNAALVDFYPGDACSIDHIDPTKTKIFSNYCSKEAESIVKRICAANGSLTPNFKIFSAPISGASAVFYNKERYIFYSDDYITRNTKKSVTSWAAYFIFAHEIAHHLNGDMLDTSALSLRKTYELAADKWAGYALHMLGAPKKKTLAWVKGEYVNTQLDYYPSETERYDAVKSGWESLSEIPLTNKFYLSIGLSTAIAGFPDSASGSFKVDGTYYESIDLIARPAFGRRKTNKVLSHFAIGISYSPFYNIAYRRYDTYYVPNIDNWIKDNHTTDFTQANNPGMLSRFSFTAKAYIVDYYKSNFNCSVSYMRGWNVHQYKLGLDYSLPSKRFNFEGFLAPTSLDFTANNYSTWKMLIGASVNYSFKNVNAKPKK